MKLKSPALLNNIRGTNLVELVVTVFIASFFAVALVSVYSTGVRYYKDSITLNMMYTDGFLLFRELEDHFRRADQITLLDWNYENERITLHQPNFTSNAIGGGDIEIYFDQHSKTLRMDDGRPDFMEYNKQLMPPIYVSGRRRTTTFAYTVKSVVFEQALDLIDEPANEQHRLIRMKLVLQDPDGGDTLALGFTALNMNVPQGN
jgi:hypothetical protein